MSIIDTLYPLTRQQCKRASEILANAFSEKPMLKLLKIPTEDMRNMFEMMVRFSLRYGEVYSTSEKLEGIMAFLPDSYAKMRSWHMLRSGAIFPVLKIKKQLMNILKVTEKILEEEKKNLSIGPYILLLSIGISQGQQGKGLGGKMLKALIEKAENEGRAIYLETDTADNVKLYEYYGFNVLKEIIIPNLNIPMWTMARLSRDKK
ncbi:GNAT family N-acetyltransferase [Spirochaetota bacterium]